MFTALQWLSLPAIPVVLLQRLVPFGGFLLFLLLFLAVVRNQKVPYFIRFNVLVLLTLAFNVLLTPLGARFAIRTLSNTVYLGTLVLVLFAVVQCVRGKEADIPTVSEAVRMQLY